MGGFKYEYEGDPEAVAMDFENVDPDEYEIVSTMFPGNGRLGTFQVIARYVTETRTGGPDMTENSTTTVVRPSGTQPGLKIGKIGHSFRACQHDLLPDILIVTL